jgi:predicted  nucleic acid-binding Zn-ribbon protein
MVSSESAPSASDERSPAGGASPGGTAPGPAPQLRLLLELQEGDLSLDRLAYRRRELAERASVAQMVAAASELKARITEAQAQSDTLASQLQALEQRSESVGARVATIEQRLRSGRAGSYRDEQTMGEESSSLGQQRRELEDQELEVMEALEPLDNELAGLKASAASTADELAVANEQLRIAEAAIDEEAAVVRDARGKLAARVAPDLLVSYERLRAKLGGIGAAHLEGGACSGCHLQIPAGELHRLRHSVPDSVVYCDQCGRILIP